MLKITVLPVIILLLTGCASNVRFIQTDEHYQVRAKSSLDEILFRSGEFERPHQIIGVIEAELGGKARKPELDALLIRKAREIGADGLMLVEYDTDKNIYWEKHRTVVGPGYRKPRVIVSSRPRVEIRRTASALAVIFK